MQQVKRRWLPGQPRASRPANALHDIDLLVRVRDRLKELPDEVEPVRGSSRVQDGGHGWQPDLTGQSSLNGQPGLNGQPSWQEYASQDGDANGAGHANGAGQVNGAGKTGNGRASGEPGGEPGLADQGTPAGRSGAASADGQGSPAAEAEAVLGASADRDGDPVLAAIRATFDCVAAAGDMAAAYFYGWLFVNHPELRDLFPPAMDEQRDRLFRALTRIVHSLSTPDEMAAYLAELGRDHRKYEVRPEMYAAVGDALIATLRAFAGQAFTPAAEEAWTKTYGVASEVMIKAANEADARTPAFWPAEVVEHEKRGQNIAVLTVATDELLPYQAGQHVTLQTSRWPRVWRPFSVACRPREDGLLRFHVRAISGGWVSTALVEHTSVGDPLIIGPAVGTMTLATAGTRDLVCIAGGTGLAPLKAIAEQVLYEETRLRNHRQVLMFCGARTQEEFYDLPGLWRLSDAYPWLQIHTVASQDPGYEGMQGNVGRVAARYMPQSDCETFVAGPAAMVRDTIRALAKAGVPEQRIHFDDGVLAGRQRVGTGT